MRLTTGALETSRVPVPVHGVEQEAVQDLGSAPGTLFHTVGVGAESGGGSTLGGGVHRAAVHVPGAGGGAVARVGIRLGGSGGAGGDEQGARDRVLPVSDAGVVRLACEVVSSESG